MVLDWAQGFIGMLSLAVPSFAQGQYFMAFTPYMKPNTVLMVMPARSGGNFLFSAELDEKAKTVSWVSRRCHGHAASPSWARGHDPGHEG